MGYQALLFCPDEKTARTVTQVLSELEFSVESCIEPFAAVKKLMGQHFDAVVVDCDNEQNATLLFKSARNSTSNQTSLAVAVVEGQAGVAKAFRIGANLVLTKPINIEQAKGTLRVARGLLRKGEPAKPGAAASTPTKAVPAKPVPPAKTAVPDRPAISTPHAAAPPEVKPTPAWPETVSANLAFAANNPAAHDDDLLEIFDDSIASPTPGPIESALNKLIPTDSQPVKLPAAASADAVKTAFNAGLPSTHGSGAASAPAPAREALDSHAAEVSPAPAPAEAEVGDKAVDAAAPSESRSYAGSEPSFTFGGANAPAQATGGFKKILLGAAAAALVAAALYVGWTKFQGRAAEPDSTATPTTAPVVVPQTAKPGSAKPAPVVPSASAHVPSSQPGAVSAKAQPEDDAFDDAFVPSSTKSSSSTSPAAGKTAAEAKSEDAPLVVKGGKAPALHSKTAAADAPAPSMMGIAAAGAGAPPPDLVSAEGSSPKPILQTLNVSQGVSQGLLLKKVQPIYPKNALLMRVEGPVELTATISKTGAITQVKVLSGDTQLTRAASDAVRQWKYKPYLLNGEPVEIQTQVTINFKLPK